MSNAQIVKEARRLAPELDWIESDDPEEYGGSGDGFAGAAIGLEGAPATITIAKLGDRWISELIATRGTFVEPGGERQIFCVCKGAISASQAWEAMLVMCEAAGSVHRGLEAARTRFDGEAVTDRPEVETLAAAFSK